MTVQTPNLRNIELSLEAYCRSQVDPAVLPLLWVGTDYDTPTHGDFAEALLDSLEGGAYPDGTAWSAAGILRFDVRHDPIKQGDEGQVVLGALTDVAEVLRAALERAQVPVFSIDAFSGQTSKLNAAVTAGATSMTVVGTGYPASGEVTVGPERVTYTGSASAGSNTTLSGCTRGVGRTKALAHTSGTPVAFALGAALGFVRLGEMGWNALGRDAATGHLRGLARFGLRVDYGS